MRDCKHRPKFIQKHSWPLLIAAVGLFSAGGPSACAAVIAHYSFDSSVNDSVGSNNLSLATGTQQFTSTGGRVAFGSGALELDGDTHYALTSNLIFTASDAWSVSFWLKRDDAGEFRGMILGDASDTVDSIWVTQAGNKVRFRNTSNVETDFPFDPGFDLHHYAVIADGAGNMSAYIDNVLQSTQTATTTFELKNVGHAYTDLAFRTDGSLDELFIFDHALNAGEVANLFDSNVAAAAIPEPSSLLTFAGLGLCAGVGAWRRRRKKAGRGVPLCRAVNF